MSPFPIGESRADDRPTRLGALVRAVKDKAPSVPLSPMDLVPRSLRAFPFTAPTRPRGVDVPPKVSTLGVDYDTDWARERGAVVAVDDRGGGTIRVPNVPWRFGASPDVGVSGVPKYRGEDNRAVLGELLDFDDDRLDRLEADGVLSSRLPTGSSDS